jgi:lysozyme family protein
MVTIPTSHDRSFIPYPLGYDPKFEKCLPDTLKQEGGYSNDAHDPGGMTMEGIIQREYDLKRKQWGLATRWVKDISADEYRTIYFTDYWMPHCPALPAGLDLEFFDLDVNGGPHRAVEILQKAIGITADGQWGDMTESAVKDLTAAGDVTSAIENYKVYREKFYRGLSTFRYFGTDWIRRSEEIATEGKAMEA